MTLPRLDLASLSDAYATGTDPADVVASIYRAIRDKGERPTWISLLPEAAALKKVEAAKRRQAAGETLPLFGVPFAIKDNIDLAGLPTTAACPEFAYQPQRSATVVEKLEAAGAIPLGKTNLDQFATGLNGTRSPYGIPSSVFDARYISGGSSAGSAVAVAAGLVSFALGTDTAGSGRVPAAFNNIVGLKPTKGWLSTRGVVPACRSQDCVSVFAASADDAFRVAEIAAGFDDGDPYSRQRPSLPAWRSSFRFGVPAQPLEFFGDREAARLFDEAAARLERLGGTRVAIDFSPFRDAAALLYSGPWLAERLSGIADFVTKNPDAINPVVRNILLAGQGMTAVDAFKSFHSLAELIQKAEREWQRMEVLLLPTAGTTYTIDEMLAEPVRLNSNLGIYTNFVNLMDLSALAVPAGFRRDGLPFGVTLIARAFQDAGLADLGSRLHGSLDGATVGATGHPLPATRAGTAVPKGLETMDIAVIGAHLSGQPLNHQLTDRGATLKRTTRTAAGYRLYALANTSPAKPGLIYDKAGQGAIEVEIWEMPRTAFGSFLSDVAPPLGIGTLLLDDGSLVKGFLCEGHAVAGAKDITGFGGWRAYIQSNR